MKKLNTLIAALMFLWLIPMTAQVRYLDKVFTDVNVTTDVLYSVNATVLLLPQTGEAVPQPLRMDIYEPAGDTETARPLAIICHTGNFLPFPQNGGTQGTRKDSSIVYIAKQLALRGYVAAIIDYRLGWNPIAQTQDERVFTLINAAYRGVQDARTCIRYFKKDVAEGGNNYGVDPNKIMLWGDGTGGYITLAAASIDAYQEIVLPKFIINVGGNPLPMVLEGVNGDIYGTSVGIVPPGFPGFPAGDTLCYPNHVGYDSEFQLSVNMGGAIGDTSWIDPGGPAIISFHVPTDPFAPYVEGTVLVPVVNLPVVEVQGSYLAVKEANADGLNSAFAGMSFTGDFSAVANSRNDGYSGLFPLIGVIPQDSSPWQWWNKDTNPNSNAGLQTNPNMSAAKGMSYCDTMIAYVTPRACLQLGLYCPGVTDANEVQPNQVGLNISPNPASEVVRFETKAEYPIEHIYIYDMNGRLVKAHTNVNSNQFTMERNSLNTGTYVARVLFKDSFTSKKIMFR